MYQFAHKRFCFFAVFQLNRNKTKLPVDSISQKTGKLVDIAVD